jgi:hypothetical protein
VPVDRNTQINFQGDPAKEMEFINSQEPRTTETARAAMPQLAVTETEALNEAIRGADILDPTAPPAFEAADAPPGAEQGAHVNADFEDNVRTGADASGDQGDEGDAFMAAGVDPELAERAEHVTVADPSGGEGDTEEGDTAAPTGASESTESTGSKRKK